MSGVLPGLRQALHPDGRSHGWDRCCRLSLLPAGRYQRPRATSSLEIDVELPPFWGPTVLVGHWYECESALTAKFVALMAHMDERQRRLALGAEARLLGHSRIPVVAKAVGAQPGVQGHPRVGGSR